jgi:hypothetical protein
MGVDLATTVYQTDSTETPRDERTVFDAVSLPKRLSGCCDGSFGNVSDDTFIGFTLQSTT